jgi:hypothetical protein
MLFFLFDKLFMKLLGLLLQPFDVSFEMLFDCHTQLLKKKVLVYH